MNVSAGTVHATPGAPLTATDISVVQDAGILTNVSAPAVTRVLNPTAIALDNPAGTGAPFDKKDQVYKIYQRWPEKSTTINGSLQSGAELIRISLNPSTLPPRLLDWVNFHQSCIPAIDVAIAIGGAAGTISWLVLGWIPDDSQPATLDSIQQVSCEHVNMNNTMVMRFALNDNRRAGLFRRLPDDDEKWPAMVLLVNHPALNVQRNDDVNYPIDVYVRFAPNAVFMEPFNIIGSGGDLSRTIDLSYYLKIDPVDILIGAPNVCNTEEDVIDLPDFGWNTGNFTPQFDSSNLLCARYTFNGAIQRCFLGFEDEDYTQAQLDSEWQRINPNGTPYACPLEVYFGFGVVPKRFKDVKWPQTAGQPSVGLQATVYSIQDYDVRFGRVHYKSTQMFVYEFGCIISFKVKYKAIGPYMIINGLREDQNDGSMLPFKHDDAGDNFVMYALKKGDHTYSVTADTGVKGSAGNGFDAGLFPRSGGNPDNRFYVFTYVQTGNSAASSALPTGLKTLSIVRPGTTTTLQDYSAFWPIMAPDIRGAKKVLEEWRLRLNTMWLAFDAYINGANFGTVVYAEGIMACRASTPRQIFAGVPTKILAQNIRAISNPSAISNINMEGFTNWWAAPAASRMKLDSVNYNPKPRFAFIPMQKEAAGFGIGAAAGLTNGIMDWFQTWQQNEWNKEYQNRQIQMMLDLQSMRNRGQLDLADKNYQNKLSALGYSAPSANNAQKIDFTDQETNTNPSPLTSSVGSFADIPKSVENNSIGTTTDVIGAPVEGSGNKPNLPPPPAWMKGAVPTPFLQAGYDGTEASMQNIDEEDINAPPPLDETEQFIRGGPGRQPMRQASPPEPPVRTFSRPPPQASNEVFDRRDETRQAFRVKNNQPSQPLSLPSQERLIGGIDKPIIPSMRRQIPERSAIRVNNSELDQMAFDHFNNQPLIADTSQFQRGGPGRVPLRKDPLIARLTDLNGIPSS